jgi:hypothetical protein
MHLQLYGSPFGLWEKYAPSWHGSGTLSVRKLSLCGKVILLSNVLIGGYGPAKIVPVSEVTDVRTLGYFNSIFHLGFPISKLRLTGGRIAVECHKGTETFGFKLKENEASAFVEKLNFHLNRNI